MKNSFQNTSNKKLLQNEQMHRSFFNNDRIATFTKGDLENFKIKKKKQKFFNKNKKALISSVLYILTSIISYIYFKSYPYYRRSFFPSYVQLSSLTTYIPISFIITVIQREFVNKAPAEQEKTSSEMGKSLRDNFSDILEKKYYENYYHYYKNFHMNIVLLAIFQFSSECFFYFGIRYVDPLFCNVLISLTPIYIIVFKMCIKGIYYKFLNILSILTNLFLISFFGVYYIFTEIIKRNLIESKQFYGIILILFSCITQVGFIKLFRKIRKKYKYYIDVNEVIGFIGLFILLPIPVLLLLLHYFNGEHFYFPNGVEFLIRIGEGFFTGFINDYLMIRCMQYLNKMIFANTYGIIYGLIYFWYFFKVKFNQNQDPSIVLFILGETFVFALIILSFLQYYGMRKDSKRKRRLGRGRRFW